MGAESRRQGGLESTRPPRFEREDRQQGKENRHCRESRDWIRGSGHMHLGLNLWIKAMFLSWSKERGKPFTLGMLGKMMGLVEGVWI